MFALVFAAVSSHEALALVLGAVLSSSVITAVVAHLFGRSKTAAETKDILADAATKSLEVMRLALEYQAKEIEELRRRVAHLEETVARYEELHGPLPPPHVDMGRLPWV
jgi:ubiquinone biosynthesis protein UbiJ